MTTSLSFPTALPGLGRAVGCNYWRLLPCSYIPDPGCFGAGRVGPAGASLWLGSLLVLDSELLGWEEVFFPVEATFGNRAGTSPISFPKCPPCSCLLGMALAPSKGHFFWAVRKPLLNIFEG